VNSSMSKPKPKGAVERWFDLVFQSGIRSTSTQQTYTHFLNRYCEFAGKTPDQLIAERREHLLSKDEMTKRQHEELLGKWQDSMEKGEKDGKKVKPLARGSVVTAHNIICSFYYANYAALVVKSPKSWKTRPSSEVVPSPEELARMLKRSRSLRDRTIIICLAQSGVSLEDFRELILFEKIKDELDRGIEPLHLPMMREKIKKKYDTFWGVDALEQLRLFVKDVKHKGPVFTLSQRAIEYIVHKTSVRAGLKPPITPHRLRAFFSTYMGLSFHTEQANHIPLVEYWMGHKLPYKGTYMVPPLEIQRTLYKQHEWAINVMNVSASSFKDHISPQT